MYGVKNSLVWSDCTVTKWSACPTYALMVKQGHFKESNVSVIGTVREVNSNKVTVNIFEYSCCDV